MHLMYSLDSNGQRVYTLKKSITITPNSTAPQEEKNAQAQGVDVTAAATSTATTTTKATKITESAHPARFSPDDKFSQQRVACKKRFGIYLPDLPRSQPL